MTHTPPMKRNLMGGGVDISLPNVSYCEDVKDVHYTPYNLVRFYVGDITPPQTVSIYTDENNHVDVTVSESNKWYTYVLPKDKGLYMIQGDAVKKVVVKADISFIGELAYPRPSQIIIPNSTVEASFKGSSKLINVNGMFNHCSGLTSLDVSSFDTSNITSMKFMFYDCESLTSLDVSNFNTSNVTNMSYMFDNCKNIEEISMGCYTPSRAGRYKAKYYYTFRNCHKLKNIDYGLVLFADGDNSNGNGMVGTFENCYSLKYITFQHIDVDAEFTNLSSDSNTIFKGCNSLQAIFIGNWWEFSSDDKETITNEFRRLLNLSGINPDTVYIGIYNIHIIN